MKHPDAPMFPAYRTYRICRLIGHLAAARGQYVYCVEYRTIFGNWRGCSGVFTNQLDAESHQRNIKFGLPGWEPI